MFFIGSLSFFADPATLDLTTLCLIGFLLLLSLLSLFFIFHLRFKSRTSLHLQRFNSLWTIRFLLVLFVCLWSLNELLRFSFFRTRRYLLLHPFQSSTLCQLHSLFSLGLFQPCFLITLLLLINASNHNSSNTTTTTTKSPPRPIPFLLLTSTPFFLLHIFIIFYTPTSPFFNRISPSYSFTHSYESHETTVLCSYPFLASIAFSLFSIPYLFTFFISSWKLASLVINKSLRIRVYALAFTLLISLPIQIISLAALSLLWTPHHPAYSLVSFLLFFATFLCAAIAQAILVIVPISDSLAAHAWDHPPNTTTPNG